MVMIDKLLMVKSSVHEALFFLRQLIWHMLRAHGITQLSKNRTSVS